MKAQIVSSAPEALSLREEPLWLKNANNPKADVCLQAISHTARAVYLELRSKGPKGMDLSAVDPMGSAPHLAALLRVTFIWRNEIPGWAPLQKAACQAATERGDEAARLIIGLGR